MLWKEICGLLLKGMIGEIWSDMVVYGRGDMFGYCRLH